MTRTLLILNAFALSAVVALIVMPADSSVGTLEYRTSVQAHKAVLGQNPSERVSAGPAMVPTKQNLSF